jgi:enamine deaminase RidA (YjgF/YER057c/UK114 family)
VDERKAIIPAGMEAVYEKICYAPAVKVGNTVYVSGQIGRGAGMKLVEERGSQIRTSFRESEAILVAAGGTLADVVNVTTLHTDIRDLPLFMEVRDRYLNTHPLPAWTAVGAHMLGGAACYIVETKAVAVLSD